jgi:hypothetical protein
VSFFCTHTDLHPAGEVHLVDSSVFGAALEVTSSKKNVGTWAVATTSNFSFADMCFKVFRAFTAKLLKSISRLIRNSELIYYLNGEPLFFFSFPL